MNSKALIQVANRDNNSSLYWVTAIELNDLGSRRHPDLPWVFLTYSARPPERWLERLKSGNCKHWANGQATHILPQFSSGPFENKNIARKTKLKFQRELSALGYTVNRDQTIWRVYVIELDQQHSPDPTKPYVYVGETSLSPEARFQQHKEGAKNKKGTFALHSSKRQSLIKHLRYDLCPNPNIFHSRDQSVNAERKLISELRVSGFQVEGGHNATND